MQSAQRLSAATTVRSGAAFAHGSAARMAGHGAPARAARSRLAIGVAALAIAGLGLAGCAPSGGTPAASNGSGTSGTTASSVPTGSTGSTGGDAPKGSGTVTILTHDSFAMSDELIAQFEQESGYKLTVTNNGDAGAEASQLILKAGNPSVDGFYGIDNFSAQSVIDAGVVDPYTSPDLPESAKPLLLGDSLTPIDQGQVCLNTDHAWFTENNLPEPKTLDDIAKPEYAKLTVLTNPTTSSPGLAFLAATIAEKGDGWKDYWATLLKGGAKVDGSWSDAYNTDFSGAEGKGQFPIVLSYSSSPAFSEGATGNVDGSCTTQVEYAGVTKGAKNPDGAKAFIDFMLSKDFQGALPEAMYMYPVDDAIELPEEWAKYAKLVPNPIQVKAEDVAKNHDAWLKDWTAVYESR